MIEYRKKKFLNWFIGTCSLKEVMKQNNNKKGKKTKAKTKTQWILITLLFDLDNDIDNFNNSLSSNFALK